MPIVPVEENRVGLAGLTDEKLRPADYSGSGLEALGAGLAGLGSSAADFAASLPRPSPAEAAHARLLRTDLAAKQAWNDGHEANAAMLDDFRQLKGKDARAALAPVAEAMAQNLHAVRLGHEDDHVRAIIDGTLAHRTAQDIVDLHAHADAQDAIAQAQESQRLIDNSASDALRHADDPKRFDHAIATGENTLRRQGQLAGKAKTAIDGEITAWRSARYVAAVHALAPSDGLGATALFERYRDALTPADRAGLEPLLHEPMAQTQAIADIDTAALAAAPFAPLTPQGDPLLADRMRTITSHFDRVVLPELMQRYGGDAARAWAATQIGADAVDDLVKQHGHGWYQALPEMARNAVAHNFALLRADSSARAAPQDRAAVEASLAGLDDARRGYAQRELTLRSNRADQARRAAQGAAADQAHAIADQLGHDFTSLAQLPAKVRADLSDQTSTALQRQADANIDPQPVAPEGVVSHALRDVAATAPEAFRDLDLREYRPLVSADEYAMFERVQQGGSLDRVMPGYAYETARPQAGIPPIGAALREGAPSQAESFGLQPVNFVASSGEVTADLPVDAEGTESGAAGGGTQGSDDSARYADPPHSPIPLRKGMELPPKLSTWLKGPAAHDRYSFNVAPDFITQFRAQHPEFVRREKENLALSKIKPWFGSRAEHTLLVYQNILNPGQYRYESVVGEQNLTQFYYPGTKIKLPFGEFPEYKGFKLIIAEHAHPTAQMRSLSEIFANSDPAYRGPSNADISYAWLNPDVYCIIKSVYKYNTLYDDDEEEY
jgi:soluble lytic murein transglycosylase